MKFFNFGSSDDGPHEGDSRPLEAPAPLTGHWEQESTHLIYVDGDWRPAVVERLGSDERPFVVEAMRTWPDDEDL